MGVAGTASAGSPPTTTAPAATPSAVPTAIPTPPPTSQAPAGDGTGRKIG
jgi:hypothetical protein